MWASKHKQSTNNLQKSSFSKITFDVANTAMGHVLEKKEQKTREKEKKKDLIHSHRCVTLLLPQQKFTTELMTKGRAPCSLLWPGEQYEGCERLILLHCWQVGPLSNLWTHFSMGPGSRLTAVGKPGLLTATEPSPRAQTGTSLWRRKIISIVRLWLSL